MKRGIGTLEQSPKLKQCLQPCNVPKNNMHANPKSDMHANPKSDMQTLKAI